jgi:preprotein translocase subunit Sec63
LQKVQKSLYVLGRYVRGDQEGLFKLVTLDRILNRITRVTSGCWWLVVVNAIPISDICQINQLRTVLLDHPVFSIRHIINIVEFATLGGCRSSRHIGE